MSLLTQQAHKLTPGSSLFIMHRTMTYPPFFDYKIQNIEEHKNKIQVDQHYISSYRPKNFCGGQNEYLTTLKFTNPGNYKIVVTEISNSGTVNHNIDVECKESEMVRETAYSTREDNKSEDELKNISYNNKLRDDMDERNEKAMDFAEKLKQNGHTCVRLLESFPVQVSWCNQYPCKQ